MESFSVEFLLHREILTNDHKSFIKVCETEVEPWPPSRYNNFQTIQEKSTENLTLGMAQRLMVEWRGMGSEKEGLAAMGLRKGILATERELERWWVVEKGIGSAGCNHFENWRRELRDTCYEGRMVDNQGIVRAERKSELSWIERRPAKNNWRENSYYQGK